MENFETSQEKIPAKESILEIINTQENGERTLIREKSDEKGLYLLEISFRQEDGSEKRYEYLRKGAYLEGSSAKSSVSIVYYEGDMPVGGEGFADFDEENNIWIKQ